MKVKVTVWGENVHEQKHEAVQRVYPDGMHTAIAAGLNEDPAIEARTATLQEPEHGLTEAVLAETDVLTWWGHAAHREVQDEIVDRVQERVLQGMGLILLHSAHFSKVFKRLMGTGCALHWRECGEKERLWVAHPGHPIVKGLGEYFELPHVEMYGEPFGIPVPDEQVFISWFAGGEVFRSGCCWHRGAGKVFYFRPGHETYPIFFDETVKLVMKNAVKWATCYGDKWEAPLKAPNVPIDKAPEPLTDAGEHIHKPGEEGLR